MTNETTKQQRDREYDRDSKKKKKKKRKVNECGEKWGRFDSNEKKSDLMRERQRERERESGCGSLKASEAEK